MPRKRAPRRRAKLRGRKERRSLPPAGTVWRDPDCGCCHDWVKHLQDHGFAMQVRAVPDTVVPRRRFKVPAALGRATRRRSRATPSKATCPHVTCSACCARSPTPSDSQCPACRWVAPGTDGPAQGGRRDPFDLPLMDRGGHARVFQRYR